MTQHEGSRRPDEDEAADLAAIDAAWGAVPDASNVERGRDARAEHLDSLRPAPPVRSSRR
jgi:hypothetical protein